MTITWLIYLFLVVAFFAGIEAYALHHGKQTLSRLVWDTSKVFPILPWIVGAVVGILAAHFWWGGALICFSQQ